MTKIQVWKNIVVAVILVGEPILFTLKPPVSVPLLLLQETWPIQAVIGFCLTLLGMTKTQSLEMITLAIIFVGETLLFTLNDRALLSIIIIRVMLTFPIQVFIGFYWVLLSPKISTWSIPRRIITISSALLHCFWISIFVTSLLWGAEQIRNTAQLGENSYYLTTRVDISGPSCDFFCGFTIPALYKCNSMGLECVLIFDDGFIDVSESGLVVDKNANELQLFLSYSGEPHSISDNKYRLFYIYGKQPRFITGSDEFGSSIYYLTALQKQDPPIYLVSKQEPTTYMLYKCNQDSLDCKRLQFEYIDRNNDDIEVDIDNTGKLSIIDSSYGANFDELLIFTYNIHRSQPVCYITDCTLMGK